jgi:hypothetical protein
MIGRIGRMLSQAPRGPLRQILHPRAARLAAEGGRPPRSG